MAPILSREKDPDFVNNFPTYCNQIKTMVSDNLKKTKSFQHVTEKCGLFHDKDYMRWFTLTGAMQTDNINNLGEAKNFFQAKSGRLFRKGNKFILRGPRYLTAIDPSLSIIQQLEIYIEDLHEGIEYLKRMKNVSGHDQYRTHSPILDYVKNSIITLTNALFNREKRIRQNTKHHAYNNLDDPDYNKLKEDIMKAGCHATYIFYLSLLGEYDYSSNVEILSAIVPTTERVCEVLRREYRAYDLSSRDFVRPEASHPLILLSFSSLLLNKIKNVDTIIGLPAGGTEIAYLVYQSFFNRKCNKCDLVLIPISLHSMLNKWGEKSNLDEILPKYWQQHKDKIIGKKILILDDNSSSGSTLHEISTSLYKFHSSLTIEVAVAEADIQRTFLDLNDPQKRTHYADPIVYKHSVGILPVSRKIWRKHDLKEVVEAFSIGGYYDQQARCYDRLSNLRDKIKAEVFSREAKDPFERIVAEPEWHFEKKIDKFRHTFLSNFHKVNIPWRGMTFPSVEHAYQSAKFDSNALENIPVSLWHTIEDMLEQTIPVTANFFTRESRSGSIKKVANLLTEKKFIRDNWDEIRVETMIELLITKFSLEEMKNQLILTENKYLIEGNDWKDTFWGACKEKGRYRGRNILGFILMNIRDKITNGVIL